MVSQYAGSVLQSENSNTYTYILCAFNNFFTNVLLDSATTMCQETTTDSESEFDFTSGSEDYYYECFEDKAQGIQTPKQTRKPCVALSKEVEDSKKPGYGTSNIEECISKNTRVAGPEKGAQVRSELL